MAGASRPPRPPSPAVGTESCSAGVPSARGGPTCHSPPLPLSLRRGPDILGTGHVPHPPLSVGVGDGPFPMERAGGGGRRGAVGFMALP